MPQGALIDFPGFNPQSTLGCEQGRHGDTGISSTGNDGAVGLGACGQDIAEKLSGLAVQLVALVDLLTSGHLFLASLCLSCLEIHRFPRIEW